MTLCHYRNVPVTVKGESGDSSQGGIMCTFCQCARGAQYCEDLIVCVERARLMHSLRAICNLGLSA